MKDNLLRQPKSRLADQIVELHALLQEALQRAAHFQSRAERAEETLASAQGRTDMSAQDARQRAAWLEREVEWLRERLVSRDDVAVSLASALERVAKKDDF